MDLITDPTAAPSDPGVPTLTGTRGWFTGGVPGVTSATRVRYWFLNMIVNELIAIVTAAGITPSPTAQNQVLTAIRTIGRIKLAANLSLYVNASTGSDSTGDGLTAGTAWATIQKAINVIYSAYDTGGSVNVITIHCVGAFTLGATAVGATVGNGSITIDGGGSATVEVTNAACFVAVLGASLTIQNFALLTATGTPINEGIGLACNGGSISFQAVNFGSCANADLSCLAGSITAIGSYTISGSSGAHANAASGGVITVNNVAVTLSGSPSFSIACVEAQQSGSLNFASVTWSGTATGVRFDLVLNGTLYTAGAQTSPTTNYIPGSAPGVTSTGGAYA
jgi:hypothetical protein